MDMVNNNLIIFQFATGKIQNIRKAENIQIGDEIKVNIESHKEKAPETIVETVVEVDELAELKKQYPQYSDSQLKKANKCMFPGCKIINVSKHL